MAKAKKAETAEAVDEGERIEAPEATETGASNPQNPEGWHPDRLRARGSVRASQVSRMETPPDYEPKHSSEAYLSVSFGTIPEDMQGDAPNMARAQLETVKEAWKEVDEARGPIMRNDMESEARRLDQLDQYAEQRRQRAEQAVTQAVERIDREIEASHDLTATELKPTRDETPLVATWQATLATKDKDELREIVAGALADKDMLVLKAALGSREWMLPMGASRQEMLRRYENELGNGRAEFRDKLHGLKERLDNTQRSVTEHFSGVLSPQQKADLKRARERQAAAQQIA